MTVAPSAWRRAKFCWRCSGRRAAPTPGTSSCIAAPRSATGRPLSSMRPRRVDLQGADPDVRGVARGGAPAQAGRHLDAVELAVAHFPQPWVADADGRRDLARLARAHRHGAEAGAQPLHASRDPHAPRAPVAVAQGGAQEHRRVAGAAAQARAGEQFLDVHPVDGAQVHLAQEPAVVPPPAARAAVRLLAGRRRPCSCAWSSPAAPGG